MTTLIAPATGALAGIGLWLAVGVLAGWQILPTLDQLDARAASLQRTLSRFGATGLFAMVTLALTRWPVAAEFAGVATMLAPRLLGGSRAGQAAIDKAEAIASWAESVRDTMAAAAGLEEALTATAVAPPSVSRCYPAPNRSRHGSSPPPCCW